jgi:hypothetical protein
MREADPTQIPKSTREDIALTIGKIVVSLIPFGGGAATEVLGAIFTPQIEKRRIEWWEGLADRLYELSKKVDHLTPENLSKNEEFVTTCLHASQLALLNHQREKLDALQNAVLHSALAEGVDADHQLMFVHLIDALTPSHLRLLKYLDNPREWLGQEHAAVANPNGYVAPPLAPIIEAFPELSGRTDSIGLYINDLYNRGLILANMDVLERRGNGIEATGGRTSQFGQRFLHFIATPSQLSN